jgi:hypothetical protein
MIRILLICLGVTALVYVGLCAALFAFQRSLIYFPQPRSQGDGTSVITLPVEGATVNVTVRPYSGSKALIYFGGNSEDVSRRLLTFSTAFPDHALYFQHYRGYGGSSGKPSEAALFADAIALFDKVYEEYPNITVVGRSLGSGVAAYLASQRPVARLVLVTPYNSIQELAEQHFPYFPVCWLLVDKFESWKYVELINAPTLIIAAQQDEVIPCASTESLFNRFRAGTAFLKVIAGTSHNTISDSPEYISLLREES